MSTERALARLALFAVPAALATMAYFGSPLLSSAQAEDKAAITQKSDSAQDDPAAIASLEAVKARAASADYQRARFDPIHNKPAIDFATNAACLVCHKEIAVDKPREETPAGVKKSDTLAWYQTLDTYAGDQQMFHWRHLESPYAKQVMDLKCTFCHQGSDQREKSAHVVAPNATGDALSSWANNAPPFTLRKTVNPSETCLRCHGAYPAQNMGLEGKWPELREALESPETPNGCLTCHTEQFRTVRHQVNYLKADEIEKLAKSSSDVCYGCHGGRQWYRISYPYPRHPWPGMPAETPDWAKDRAAKSDPRFEASTK